MIKKTLLALTFAGLAFSAFAQQSGIKRTPLQKIDFPEGYTTVTAVAEVPRAAPPAATLIPGSRRAMYWRARPTSSSRVSRTSI